MELHEFEIGQLRAGPRRNSQAITGGFGRIRCMPPGHADAAGREDNVRRVPTTPPLAMLEDEQPPYRAILNDKIVSESAPENIDGRCPAGPFDERTHDHPAGGITAGMNDSRPAMGSLAGQFQRAIQRAVERYSFMDQQTQAVGAFARQRQGSPRVAEAGTGRQGVFGMGLRGIPRPHRCSDAAFRPKARALPSW